MSRKNKFWVVIHKTGGVWPETFSFYNWKAVQKFSGKTGINWRAARRMGYSLCKVKLRKRT